ncbi:MAG: PAS domain S-box protein [Elainellaceae cyanobacterium]
MRDRSHSFSLRTVLTVPFVIQIVGIFALTGYLSFTNGRQAVDKLVFDLQDEIGDRIQEKLINYLRVPHRINQLNADAIRSGVLPTDDLDLLKQHFWQQMRVFDSVNSIYIGNSQGGILGVGTLPGGRFNLVMSDDLSAGDVRRHALDERGNPTVLLDVFPDVDIRQRPWYLAAQSQQEPTWSVAYANYADRTLGITAVYPLTDDTGEIQQVLGVDILFSDFSRFLRSLQIGRSGEAYIIDRTGRLISTSTSDSTTTTRNGNLYPILAIESENPLLYEIAHTLLQEFETFEQIKGYNSKLRVEQERHFIQVVSVQDRYGLDWLIVTAIPESDFTGQIYTNTRHTLLLCLVALGGAIALGFLTSYLISRPVRTLSQVSQAIANGELDQRVDESVPIQELQVLAQSFNQMADRVSSSFEQLQEALQTSENKFAIAFRASPDSISITTLDEGRYIEVNPSFCEFSGYQRDEIIGKTASDLGIWATPQDQDAVTQCLNQDGFIQNFEFNYQTKTGEIQTALFSAGIIRFNGNAYLLGVSKDITDRKRAELLLKQSEEQYRSLTENTADGIYSIDTQFRVIYCNSAMEEIFGRPRSHFVNQPAHILFNCVHPDDQRDVKTAFLNRELESPRLQIGYRIVRPDGDIRYLRDVIHAIRDPHGHIIRYQGIVSDITLIKEQEQLLRLQTQRERALNRVIEAIHNSLDLLVVFNTAASELTELLDADRAEVVKYHPDERVWINVADYRRDPALASALGTKIPDNGNPIAAQLKQLQIVKIEDAGGCNDPINQEFAQQFPGAWLIVPVCIGTTVWGATSVIRNCAPHAWNETEIDLVRKIADQLAIAIQQSELYQQVRQLNANLEQQVQDRTVKLQRSLNFESVFKRINDRVRQSLDEKEILRNALQELSDNIGILFGNTLLYNPVETNYLKDDDHDIISEICDSTPELAGFMLANEDFPITQRQLLEGWHFQLCVQVKQWHYDWATVLLCPILDENGVLLGDILLLRKKNEYFDSTDIDLVRQVANQCAIAIRQARLYEAAQAQVRELERLNQLKDDFLSTVSHELRTPMSNIKMATHMLEITLERLGILDSNNSATAQYFKILKDEGQREITLIDNLLDLARLEAQVEPLMIGQLELQVWIPHLSEVFVKRIHNQHQSLIIKIPDDLPPLTTDFSYLERVTVELINNACKYTPAGETITLSAYEVSIGLAIQITNTGVEIAPEERDRIFEKLYRIPSNDPWKYGGIGLGLALVQRLVECLQGEIRVESGDRQVTFTVTLPFQLTH